MNYKFFLVLLLLSFSNSIFSQTPTLECPSDSTFYANSSCEALVNYSVSCSSNCTSATITQTDGSGLSSGDIFPIGTTNQEYTITNGSGSSSCSFDIIVLDTINPNLTCIGTQNVSANANCEAILGDYTSLMSESDNCDPNPVVTQSPPIGDTIITSQNVTMYVTDNSGNIDSCTFLIIVDDNLPPTITCPTDSNVLADANCEYVLADLTGFVNITDNCDPNTTIVQHPTVGTLFINGDKPFISFNVTDISGNTSVCSYQISVVDSIPPSITCPGNQSDYITSNCDVILADYTGLSSSSDNCSGSIFIQQVPIPGTILPGNSNITPITITATDLSGNTNSCQFDFTLIDTITPVINICVNDTTRKADSNCVYIIEDFSSLLSISDNCQNSFDFTQTPSIGSTLNVGTTTQVTISVTDSSGNSDSCSFLITVVDITPPVINCPQNPMAPVDTNCSYIIPDYQALFTPTDNCDPNFIFTQSIAPGDTIYGLGTQQIIVLSATDSYGNSTNCTSTITLTDTTSPDIICPSDQIIDLQANCLYIVPDLTSLVTSYDHCDTLPIITQNIPSGTSTGGIITLIFTSTDYSGNTNTCSINLLPNDTVPPIITCPDPITSCDSLILFVNPNATDDCSFATITQIDSTGLSSGDIFPIGNSTLIFEAEDLVGNTTTCSTSIDIFEPVYIDVGLDYIIEEGDIVTINASINNASIIVWSPEYNMDDPNIENPNVSPVYSTMYYVTAESPDGCTGSDSVIVFVNQINDLIFNNIITPNGDGFNDTWNMNKPSALSGCPVSIYNRWGKMVWQSSAYNNDWDGLNENGDVLPDGTYFYTILCRGNEYKGSIILIR